MANFTTVGNQKVQVGGIWWMKHFSQPYSSKRFLVIHEVWYCVLIMVKDVPFSVC